MKRQIFEQFRKKCDIDAALREEEEAMELEDSDWANLKSIGLAFLMQLKMRIV